MVSGLMLPDGEHDGVLREHGAPGLHDRRRDQLGGKDLQRVGARLERPQSPRSGRHAGRAEHPQLLGPAHHLDAAIERDDQAPPSVEHAGHGIGLEQQVLGAQEVRVEQLRLIARAVVAQDRHDRVAGAEIARQPDRAGDVDAGRAAQAQALVLEEVEDDRQRLLVGDLVGDVDRDAFEVGGDAALADALGDRGALGLELARRVLAVERAPIGSASPIGRPGCAP